MNQYRLNLKTLNNAAAKPVDSGDAASADFNLASFTLNASLQSLDLSAKVPSTAKWVLLRVHIKSSSALGYINFLSYSNSDLFNAGKFSTPLPLINVDIYDETWIALNGSQKIQYIGSLINTTLDVTVGGYM